MYNWFTISLILYWGVMVYFFYTAIHSKIKLHNVRIKMQKQGIIEASTNINFLTFKSVVFWMFPVRKYLSKEDKEHNRLARKVNASLLGMLVMIVVFGLFTYIID